MWQSIYEQLANKLQNLADEFGQSLQDFINGLEFDRALFWEASLHGFLHEWRQHGILVDDKEYQRLCRVLGELRQKLVPADELRDAANCLQRQIADAQAHPGEIKLGEPNSPEEAALPPGVRRLGHGIMRRHAPERWMEVVEDVLASWRFAEGVGSQFQNWMAVENSRHLTSNLEGRPTAVDQTGTLPQAETGQPTDQLAMADDMPADGSGGDDASDQSNTAGGPPFNEETMRAMLRLMDPHVYRWWLRWGKLIRVNTTRWMAMLKSNADDFKLGYVLVKGKPPQINAYIYRVSDEKSEFEVARAIVQEFYKHDSGGWASPVASNPGPKFTADEAGWFQEWRKESFKVGAATAEFIAKLYVEGLLSFNPGADAVVSISDLLDKDFSLSTLAGALPFIPAMVFRRAGKASVLLKFGKHELTVGDALLDKLAKLSREYQKAIAVEITKAASKADAEKRLHYLIDGVASGAIKLHHISTDKNWISTLRGGPWSPKFERLFKKAGMTLGDAANKVLIPGHFGPHPEAYHKTIYKRLFDATSGETGEKYKKAILKELELIATEATTAGTKLNNLLTEK